MSSFTRVRLVYLVACSATKRDIYTSAQFLYCSERFNLVKDLMEQTKSEWYIISAKHGLVHPCEMLSPYNLNLEEMSCEMKMLWAESIVNRLIPEHTKTTRYVILAEKSYSDPLVKAFHNHNFKFTVPFQGMSHDAQIDYLKYQKTANVYRLYSRIDTLVSQTDGIRLFRECNSKMYWPKKGVYLFVDYNEFSPVSANIPKIVRVGTHGVSSGSKTCLWDRLKTHQGLKNGGGSHRSSVFRLHVGNALIKRDGIQCSTWALGQNASKEVRFSEQYLEKMVSEYIGDLGVIFIDINDESSSQSLRAFVESNLIAVLSTINYSMDFSSPDWLGYFSNKSEIRGSSLWNINATSAKLSPDFFTQLDVCIETTIKNFCKHKEEK